jgi:hypothetical protein
VEECILPKEGEEPLDDEAKAVAQRKLRHKLATRAFYVSEKEARPRFREHKQFGADGQVEGPMYMPLPPNQWRESILAFTKYHVIKMSRVFQSVFYLLGYSREEICERETNKLEWKKAKQLIAANEGADFFKRLGEFNPFGPKDAQFKAYQKLKFIKQNTKRYETALDALEEYSVPLARLFKWLLMSVEYRQLDVLARRDQKQKLKEERKLAEEAFAERERLRAEALEAAKIVRNPYVDSTIGARRPGGAEDRGPARGDARRRPQAQGAGVRREALLQEVGRRERQDRSSSPRRGRRRQRLRPIRRPQRF